MVHGREIAERIVTSKVVVFDYAADHFFSSQLTVYFYIFEFSPKEIPASKTLYIRCGGSHPVLTS
jgi:hypothetical protein